MTTSAIAPERADWRLLGNCASLPDPDVMFPHPTNLTAVAKAKKVCRGCPVTAACLEWADEADIRDGVWGGLTAAERGRPKKRPGVINPKRTCKCGAPFQASQANQFRCPPCSRRTNAPPTKAPARILARAADIAGWKAEGLSDRGVGQLLGCSSTTVTLARHNLGIGVDGGVRELAAVA